MPPSFNERLVRDLAAGEIRDGAARYLLIRDDTLMGLFSRLPPAERAAAFEALKASTVENGARSARTYQSALPPEQRLALLQVIEATAPQLGWGAWRFAELTPEGFRLEVTNSPFAAGYGTAEAPVCHAITGMLTASGGLALGRPVQAVETRCAAVSGGELRVPGASRAVILVPDAIFDDDHALERDMVAPEELRLRRAARAADIAEADWREAEAIVAYHRLTYDADLARRLARCRILVRAGVGTDNVDLEAFAALGIPVCRVPDYGTEEVADHSIALLLALTRGVVAFHRGLAADPLRGWDWRRWPPPVRRLRGQRLLLIGFGAIGRAVAQRAAPLGLEIGYFDPQAPPAAGGRRYDDLEAALGEADIVSLHATLAAGAPPLMNAARFAALRPGALLINTARGGLVDLEALTEALRSGHLGGAALDVLPQEPPDPAHPLFRALAEGAPWLEGRLVLTPHVAFLSSDAIADMRRGAVATALLWLREGKLRHCVNAERLVTPR